MVGDFVEHRRLVLQIARDVATQVYLRALLTTIDTTLAAHRDELLAVRRRIKRARTMHVL
jgi:hypothetical protein